MVVSDDVAGKVLEAYKANPLLTALFLMNVLTFVGFGYYLIDKDDRVAQYVLKMQDNMKELRLEAMRLTAQCKQPTTPPPQVQYVLPPVDVPRPPQRPK